MLLGFWLPTKILREENLFVKKNTYYLLQIRLYQYQFERGISKMLGPRFLAKNQQKEIVKSQ